MVQYVYINLEKLISNLFNTFYFYIWFLSSYSSHFKDLGGREIRVKFSADMVPGRKNTEAVTSAPKLGIIFESPHKAYVGNLAWSVRPEDLREHFSQYGTVVSARVLYDRKGGKNRVYGFLSFSNAEELKAAIGASGSVCDSLLYFTPQ